MLAAPRPRRYPPAMRARILTIAISFAVGCSGGDGDGGVDAGRDSGLMDAGAGASDAGRDGAVPMDGQPAADAGHDSGVGLDGAACAGPVPTCVGICALSAPSCESGAWVCRGLGYEATETSCDGYDNDCDGTTDEGCVTCAVDETAVRANLHSIWDIDFDYSCRTYLTTLISGPDFTKVVPPMGAGGSVAQYLGNANQNMGFALVDPSPVT